MPFLVSSFVHRAYAARVSYWSRTLRNHGRRFRSLSRARLRSADYPRHYRDQNDDDHHDLDVLVDSRNIPAEKKAGENHAPDPGNRADHGIDEEIPERQVADSRNHRRKRPDYRHELGENDCLLSVPLVELVGADSMLLVEEEAVLTVEDSRSGGAADEITGAIPTDGGDRKQRREAING